MHRCELVPRACFDYESLPVCDASSRTLAGLRSPGLKYDPKSVRDLEHRGLQSLLAWHLIVKFRAHVRCRPPAQQPHTLRCGPPCHTVPEPAARLLPIAAVGRARAASHTPVLTSEAQTGFP